MLAASALTLPSVSITHRFTRIGHQLGARSPRSALLRACKVARKAAVSNVRPLAMAASHGLKVVVDSNPSEEKLRNENVKGWPTWGAGVSTFPWSYSSNETCYVLEGRVIVTPDGGEPVEIKKGDYVTFPSGMSCTWEVLQPISKHYKFH